ncbi:MAG: hypothetical protein HFJ79_08520 [Clostridiales bacterium]|nr:hypothetical protein [Clostridiales bacterium]
MHERETPRGQISLQVTREEYVSGCLLAARRVGSLRALPLAVLGAAALLVIGLFSFGWGVSLFVSLLLCLMGPLILLFTLVVQPTAVRRQAEAEYGSYRSLMEPAILRLYADEAEITAPCLILTDPYALMGECIETPGLLVLIKDRQRLLVIPKRCIPEGEREELLSFFRLVFARKRRTMRSYLW